MIAKTIRVSIGITRNLGNFESLRVDALVEVDVEANKDSYSQDELWAQAWQAVEDQVSAQLADVDTNVSKSK